MNRAAAFLVARHRRAPLSEILSARDDFAATAFAPMDEHAEAFAPTQFVERRRHPRQARAGLPAMALAAAPGHAAFSAPLDEPGFGLDPDRPRGTDGFGGPARRGLLSAVERTLDRLTAPPIGTLLALLVAVSLAMAVISALLPLFELH